MLVNRRAVAALTAVILLAATFIVGSTSANAGHIWPLPNKLPAELQDRQFTPSQSDIPGYNVPAGAITSIAFDRSSPDGVSLVAAVHLNPRSWYPTRSQIIRIPLGIQINPDFTVIAGNKMESRGGEGEGRSATLIGIPGADRVRVLPNGDIVFIEYGSETLLRIISKQTGNISTIFGSNRPLESSNGLRCFTPTAVAPNAAGELLVSAKIENRESGVCKISQQNGVWHATILFWQGSEWAKSLSPYSLSEFEPARDVRLGKINDLAPMGDGRLLLSLESNMRRALAEAKYDDHLSTYVVREVQYVPALGGEPHPWRLDVGFDGSIFVSSNGAVSQLPPAATEGSIVAGGLVNFGDIPVNTPGSSALRASVDPVNVAPGLKTDLFIADPTRIRYVDAYGEESPFALTLGAANNGDRREASTRVKYLLSLAAAQTGFKASQRPTPIELTGFIDQVNDRDSQQVAMVRLRAQMALEAIRVSDRFIRLRQYLPPQ